MTLEHALGRSVDAIAKQWQVSPAYVTQRLDDVTTCGIAEQFERMILERLVPQALAIYEAALRAGDKEAARDLLFGTGVLRRQDRKLEKLQPTLETLETYRQKRGLQ